MTLFVAETPLCSAWYYCPDERKKAARCGWLKPSGPRLLPVPPMGADP